LRATLKFSGLRANGTLYVDSSKVAKAVKLERDFPFLCHGMRKGKSLPNSRFWQLYSKSTYSVYYAPKTENPKVALKCENTQPYGVDRLWHAHGLSPMIIKKRENTHFSSKLVNFSSNFEVHRTALGVGSAHFADFSSFSIKYMASI
jgi:hypothetical protein